MSDTPAKRVRYIAEISRVRDVTLLGEADLTFWRDRLERESLHPAAHDGKARLIVSSTDAKYMGIAFREVSISVFVSRREDGAGEDGVFLVHAFNSSRLFAFVERTFFGTPYYPGEIEVEARLPAAMRVRKGQETLLQAEMSVASSVSTRPPFRSGEEDWKTPIFLPTKESRGIEKATVFFARLSGLTQVYPFTSTDRLTLRASPGDPVLQWLIDSRFAGKEWHIRADATHARSRTMKRRSACDFCPRMAEL
ncbi:MAG: DUF2071 domain-containing protein [Planctomycetia bacterium]|nr:DUF2071 domain-containing protein [Planctomycetia bacterium]